MADLSTGLAAREALWSLDSLAFAGCYGGALIYVLHGKPLADWMFNQGETATTADFNNVRVYFAVGCVALFFSLLRFVGWPNRIRPAAGAAVAVLGPLAIQFQAKEPSPLIFVLHVYLSLVALLIVSLEPIFEREMAPLFWQRLFAASTKGVGYAFTLFSALAAVLQYVSRGLNESIPGYLTSLAYPVGAVVLSLVLAAFWLIAPAWRKYVGSFAPHARRPAVARGLRRGNAAP
jgi:hypothetical protein